MMDISVTLRLASFLAILPVLLNGQVAGGEFAGAKTCAQCHPRQAAQQEKSAHSRALFPAASHPLREKFAPSGTFERPPGFRFGFLMTRDELRVRAWDAKDLIDIPVEWAFGAGEQAVTFVTRVNEEWHLEHYLSYYAAADSLKPTPGQGELRADSLPRAMGVLYKTDDPQSGIADCFDCHSTGGVTWSADRTAVPAEPGVRCEACHGPGALHARSGGKDQIGNPGGLTAKEMNYFCGKCHRPPGSDGSKVDWNYSWNVRHQPLYLDRSRCFQNSAGALSCASCHDAHQPLRKNDPAYYNEKCRTCHSARVRPPSAECREDSGGGCAGCHMPAVSPQAYLRFTNHWIGVYGPGSRLTPESKRPNRR